MRNVNQILLTTAALTVASVLSSPAAAWAQDAEQVIPIAPGVSLVVTSPDMASQGALQPLPMPDPAALIQAAEQNMESIQADMLRAVMMQEGLIPASVPSIPPGAAAVVVTSFSDGHGICSQRIVYPRNGGAPQVQISASSGTCGMSGVKPAAVTPVVSPRPPALTPRAPVSNPHLVLADAAG